MGDVVAVVMADRFPVVHGSLVTRGILAGGAKVTIVGNKLNEYPVLGAWFRTNGLPDLYAYAMPALRFSLSFVFNMSSKQSHRGELPRTVDEQNYYFLFQQCHVRTSDVRSKSVVLVTTILR